LDEPDEAALSSIAAEQCRAWCLLKRLLQVRWAPAFEAYREQIATCQTLLEKNREYLHGKYLALRPEIELATKRGDKYETCDACGFLSSHTEQSVEPIFASSCTVCGRRDDFIMVNCPSCNTDIRIEELGEGECERCGYKTTLSWLVDKYGPHEDPEDVPRTAYCGYCENPEVRSVIPLGDALVCLSCLEEHNSIEQCGWCSESVAGDLEGSYLSGCLMCDGKMGCTDN
jgi:hypothetical protein